MRPVRFFPLSVMIVCLGLLSACSSVLPDWIGKEDQDYLPGKRISVLAHGSKVKRSPSHRSIIIKLDNRVSNPDWPLQRISDVTHPAFGSRDTKAPINITQKVDVGQSSSDNLHLTSNPVIAQGLVFTLDAKGNIQARKQNALKTLAWKVKISPDDKGDFLGGNIAYGNGTLYVATTHGVIYAYNASDGNERWQRSVKLPIKSTIALNDKHLFFITINNKLFALNQSDGKIAWTHLGINETTTIYGATGPAVSGDGSIVIAPYSSGELIALDAKDGSPLWSDLLIGSQEEQIISFSLNDIDATPIIHENRVYATSHDGVLKAYDLTSGNQIWKQDISSVQTPWVSGDFLYILTSNNELVCVYTPDGRVKWIGQFPTHHDPLISWGGKNKGEKIHWSGPVLAGDKLFVVGSTGVLSVVSPYSGAIKQNISVPEDIYLPPIVSNQTLYMLSDNAKLTALK